MILDKTFYDFDGANKQIIVYSHDGSGNINLLNAYSICSCISLENLNDSFLCFVEDSKL